MKNLCLFLLYGFLLASGATLGFAQNKSSALQLKNLTPVSAAPTALSFEAEVLAEINLARQKPLEYVKFLEEWKKNYSGMELRLPNRVAIVTKEGTKVVDEAIVFLKALKPLGSVGESKGLFSAAFDHLSDMQKSGKTGHQGSDGNFADARVERYGAWDGGVSEIIKYGALTPREVVIGAILDDGVLDRGHRKDLFDGKFKIVGVASGAGVKYDKMCVIVMGVNFIEKNQAQKSSKPTAKRL